MTSSEPPVTDDASVTIPATARRYVDLPVTQPIDIIWLPHDPPASITDVSRAARRRMVQRVASSGRHGST